MNFNASVWSRVSAVGELAKTLGDVQSHSEYLSPRPIFPIFFFKLLPNSGA